jgi:uncharacterized protein with PQ loop repeat
MNLDRRYLVWSLCYAVAGMTLGIFMAASQDHSELVTHAHVLLIGFVVSFIYGLIHKLWLHQPPRGLANFQFVLHQAAALTVSVGLFLMYGNYVASASADPVLAAGSIGVLVGMLLMLYMVIRSRAADGGG